MPGYRVIVDVATVPYNRRRALARKLLRRVERHRPFKQRTGNLKRQSYVELYEDLDLLVIGSKAHYTSYLNEGTTNLDGSTRIQGHPYIEDAVLAEGLPIVKAGRL